MRGRSSNIRPKVNRSFQTTETTVEPTLRQLRILALRAAIPMVGFGAMDNFVMIQAGEAIDMSLGVAFGLSTLTAAGFGQIFSDVCGLTCGGMVDALVAKLHLPQHRMSPAQLNLKVSRVASTAGGCAGVVTGCLLGMSCLLFMDTDRADRAKKARELQSIFESVTAEGHELVQAERATLWMLDPDKEELWSRVATGTSEIIKVPAHRGIVGQCVQERVMLNIPDAYDHPRFNSHVDKQLGFQTRSILCSPILNDDGSVIGALQMVNKRGEGGFMTNDEKIVQMMCSHVSTFIRVVESG